MNNALKFTFKGGIKIKVDYQYDENMLVVSVEDTGVGIKEEDKSKLFVMFGKLDSTQKINTSGIGLGLSICKKITEAFGG